jgi:hypothetical protein
LATDVLPTYHVVQSCSFTPLRTRAREPFVGNCSGSILKSAPEAQYGRLQTDRLLTSMLRIDHIQTQYRCNTAPHPRRYCTHRYPTLLCPLRFITSGHQDPTEPIASASRQSILTCSYSCPAELRLLQVLYTQVGRPIAYAVPRLASRGRAAAAEAENRQPRSNMTMCPVWVVTNPGQPSG